MSSTNFTVKSLYDLSLNNVPYSINEESMTNILESCPPSIIFNVLWKNLRVNGDDEKFLSDCLLKEKKIFLVERGRLLATLSNEHLETSDEEIICMNLQIKTQEEFIQKVQISFEDTSKFYNHFDLNLFFKLVKITENRTKLYIIFQICVRKRGLDFPKLLAFEWLNRKIKREDGTINYNNIVKRGLELGIFLSDTGWYVESSLVLAYTYKIITMKWNCKDLTLQLTRTSQCLTKWLLAVLDYYDLDKATVVLKYLLNTIEVFERVENPLCLSYLYFAVSKYFYAVMHLDVAWAWIVKSINNLRYENNTLTPMVIVHAVKICGAQNEISKGLQLLRLLYANNKEINQNIIVDIIMNEAYYYLRSHLKTDAHVNYHIALDTVQSIYGYYNLRTANIFFDYAQTICNFEYELKPIDALPAIFQAVNIMTRLGLPETNMLMVQAKQIAAHILPMNIYKTINLNKDEENETNPDDPQILAHYNAINMAKRTVGEVSLITANTYCNLGTFYLKQAKYKDAEAMYLKGIVIKERILGRDHTKVALCLDLLSHLYLYKLNYFRKAHELSMRLCNIYNNSSENFRGRLIRNRKNLIILLNIHNGELIYRLPQHENEEMEMTMRIPELIVFYSRGEFDLITTEGDFSLMKIKYTIKN